jgi:hypothetical protein
LSDAGKPWPSGAGAPRRSHNNRPTATVEPTIPPIIPIPSRSPESVLSSGTVPSFRSPTLGDISLGLRQDGYTQLQNTFGNLGLALDLNLLSLRQSAELAAFRSGLASSRAALGETERQVRFDLVSAYPDLQLRQALIPVWEKALEASTALERNAEAIRRRGLAARIVVLRREDPEGSTVARIAAGSATGPDQPGPDRPVAHVDLRIGAGWWGLSGDRLEGSGA